MKNQTPTPATTRLTTTAGRLSTACDTSLLTWLLLLPPVAVQAQDYIYTNTNGTIAITGYTGPGGAVEIPGTINGLPVAGIGYRAFASCGTLTSITIPNSVAVIGDYAFYGCGALTSVVIPDSVTSIGNSAFANCASLAGVTIPNSVTVIGNLAFSSCTRLTSLTIGSGVTNLADWAFDHCTSLASVAIPNSVTAIGSGPFSWCTSLTSITIGSGVISIGDWAFTHCASLASVAIPNSVTAIGVGAFWGCGLTSVALPKSLLSLGNIAFADCASLTAFAVDELNSSYSSLDGVLFDKTRTTLVEYPGGIGGSYTIPNSVTSIGMGAFSYCTGLTGVTIPDTVTNIGSSAFNECTSLTSITIPNPVTSIGGAVFSYCSNLTSVTLPASVTSIGDGALEYCTSLAGVYFLGNAPFLGQWVFAGDNHATIYYLPGTSGWDTTFGGRPTALWDIAVAPFIIGQPQSVSTNFENTVSFTVLAGGSAPLSYQWWKGTTSLTGAINMTFTITNVQPADAGDYSVVVANLAGLATSEMATLAVTMPFTYTTNGTINITRYTGPGGAVNIPGSIDGVPVTGIADEALKDSSSVTGITIANSVNSIGSRAFYGCTNLTSVTIPETVTRIADETFAHCTRLANVTIPSGVTNLGNYAFGSCTSLTGVYFEGNAPSVGLDVFSSADNATIYYLPGTTGWSTNFAGRPTTFWYPPVRIDDASCGVRNNQFGFNIIGTSGMVVAVLASTNLGNATWFPLATCTLTNGSAHFSDTQWTNYASRFYRMRWP